MAKQSPFPESLHAELPRIMFGVLQNAPKGLKLVDIITKIKGIQPLPRSSANISPKKLDRKYDEVIINVLHAFITVNLVSKTNKLYVLNTDRLSERLAWEITGNPVIAVRRARNAYNTDIDAQLTKQLGTIDSLGFENLVLDVLGALGYCGPHGKRQRIGGSGDNGIDGIISRDPLGFDSIFVQAKHLRPTKQVGSAMIRDFIGALDHVNSNADVHGITKGVFITTAQFSEAAIRTASEYKYGTIALINGTDLVYLMREYGVGVTTKQTFKLVEVDEDYFKEHTIPQAK